MIGPAMASRSKKHIPVSRPGASGMRPTEPTVVSSPTVPGATESVQRVVDTLYSLFRRKQIEEAEYLAGERYRMALQRLEGSVGGVMDFERARGGSSPGQPPAPAYLQAAEVVSSVRKGLYPKDYAIVYRVCALGMSIEEAAFNLPDQYERDPTGRPTRAAREECGKRLRSGLSEMRDWWFPKNAGTGNRIRGVVHEKAIATDATVAPKSSQVVHATGQKIYRSGGK